VSDIVLSLYRSARSLSDLISVGSNYENHVQQMAPVVSELAALESEAQIAFLKTHVTGH